MAIFKCKMCGGDLELSEGMSVAECEYCGSLQTVPSADNEKKMTLFSRANRLRAGCEFDKAAGVYETIVADFPEEAEAYWGLLLCRYGIEYVDDPATGKKIPTCHRSSFDSVMEDSDFEQACENADAYARRIYRDEAKAIEELRKGIIAVSANEQPYDIFICYKETADNGERTLDSVLAQDIYDALTGKGYRVFFSRVTLEDKLGVEYEPYIFAALNSAKIMLAVGTDYEYYNAVWVKNEWSRFLKLMAADKSKYLIPCFKGLDAYDMPKEFAKLQAQDMGKVGAMQDLLRGIDKIMGKSEASSAPVAAPVAAPAPAANATVDSLLKRAFMFLEDGEWDSADEYCEKVLDIDPENAQAYLGKLMAELKVRKQEKLADCEKSFDASNNYKKVLRFGDDTLRSTLEKYAAQVNQRATYISAKEMMRIASSEDDYLEAAEWFDTVDTYSDAATLAEECRKKGEECHRAEEEKHRKHQAALKKQQESNTNWSLATSHTNTVGLKADGTVVAVGENYRGMCNVSDWTDIAAVDTSGSRTVGLKSDGTVVAAGHNDDGACNVSDWTDIVAISADVSYTVGLKADGTVVATGSNDRGQCNVSDWTDIVAISANDSYTVGLKADGTVVATGSNDYGQCNVSGWTDIVAVRAESDRTVGLKADGTVVAAGSNKYGQCNVSGWTDIVAIAAGDIHTVGLKADGTVVAVGENYYGGCNVSGWTDIVAIAAEYTHTVGLKADGTVVAVGKNYYGECNVSDWTDIVAVATGTSHTVGLKADGTVVVAVGTNENGRCNVSDWKDIAVPKAAIEQRKMRLERVKLALEEKAARQKQKEEEEARRIRENAEKAERRRRAELAAKLQQEQKSLQTELAALKGLFSGKRRREIEARLAEIEKELKGLSVDEK